MMVWKRAAFCPSALFFFFSVFALASGRLCGSPLVRQKSSLQVVDGDLSVYESMSGTSPWVVSGLSLLSSPFSLPARQRTLLVPLHTPHSISAVALWGATGAYRVMYSDVSSPDTQWRFVLESNGLPKVFRSFKSDQNAKQSIGFELIAKQIRIIPMSFEGSKASFYVQVYGCSYSVACVEFGGRSVMEVDSKVVKSGRSQFGIENELTFHLRTQTHEGVIFSSVSNEESDYLLIQMKEGKLEATFDLGSHIRNHLSCGYPVNNGLWHQIGWRQTVEGEAVLVVDGVKCNSSAIYGLHKVLTLGKKILIGAPNLVHPMLEEAVRSNFTGFIQGVRYKGTELTDSDTVTTFDTSNNPRSCQDSLWGKWLVSLKSGSWIRKGLSRGEKVDLDFQFRTFALDSTIASITFPSPLGQLQIRVVDGSLKLRFTELNIPNNIFDESLSGNVVSDGLWHRFKLWGVAKGMMLSVDGVEEALLGDAFRSMVVESGLTLGTHKFHGCFRDLKWHGERLHFFSSDQQAGTITIGRCNLLNRCIPNPCENGGSCKNTLSSDSFECECPRGFNGKTCRIVTNPRSCEEYFSFTKDALEGRVWLDIDGSGPLDPFPVICNRTRDGTVTTWIHHDHPNPFEVEGFGDRGSFRYTFQYDTQDAGAVEEFVGKYRSCFQETRYECKGGSGLMRGDVGPMSWWMGRTGQHAYSWGDAEPGTRLCTCALHGDCIGHGNCNCDSGEDAVDVGNVTYMKFLPVMRLLVGDTAGYRKQAKVTIGALGCQQNVAFESVTFTHRDAYLESLHVSGDKTGLDVYVEFLTTQRNGVLLYADSTPNPPSDRIQIYLSEEKKIVVEVVTGGMAWELVSRNTHKLNDNTWHSLYFEITPFEAVLVVDHDSMSEVELSDRFLVVPEVSDTWRIGSSRDDSAGLAGLVRSLYINGDSVDLIELLENSQNSEDIIPGHFRQCDQIRCFNGGSCVELYDSFQCDCSETPFEGRFCLEDVGFKMFEFNWFEFTMRRSEKREDGLIRIGFQTTSTDVSLLKGISVYSDACIQLVLDSEGYLILNFTNDGKQYFSVRDGRRNYSDGTFNDVQITAPSTLKLQLKVQIINQLNSDALINIRVSYYEPLQMDVKDSNLVADTSMWTVADNSFEGCLSRLQLGNAFPFKEGLENRRVTRLGGNTAQKGLCPALPHLEYVEEWGGEEESGRRGAPRSFPSLVVTPLTQPNYTPVIITLSVLCVVVLLILVFCLCRCFRNSSGGVYKTHEGDQLYLSPDNSHTALVASAPPRRKEWFI